MIHFYPAAVVNAFVMGLLLGFIYIRSNSLYIVVILHAFNNALAMLLLTLGYAHTTLYELMSAHGLKMLYTVVYGVSLGIFLVAGLYGVEDHRAPAGSRSRRQPKHNNPVGLAFFCGKNYIFAHRICELLRR